LIPQNPLKKLILSRVLVVKIVILYPDFNFEAMLFVRKHCDQIELVILAKFFEISI